MNVEVDLLRNYLAELIFKKFSIDPVLKPLVSSILIQAGFTIVNFVKKVDIENKMLNVTSDDYMTLIRNFVFLMILTTLMYSLYNNRQFIIDIYKQKYCNKLVEYNLPIIRTNSDENGEELYIPTFYNISVSNISSVISYTYKYINMHPEFFESNIDKEILNYGGNDDVNLCYIYKKPLYFKDPIHNVEGYIITQRIDDDKIELNFRIDTRNINKKCYTKQIEEYVTYTLKHGDTVVLNYYKILFKSIVPHVFYNEPLSRWTEDITKLENEFFSIHKKYLFSIMREKLNGDKSTGWSNLILHGPPGSGKSTFIYRLAVFLKMSLISIDLSLYIDKKKELYSIFHGQEFSLPDGSGNKHKVNHNAIIVLEEFDNCIRKIIQLEKILQFKESITEDFLNNKSKLLLQACEKSIKKKKKSDKKKFNNFDENRERNTKLCNINADVDSIIRNVSESNKSDILRLGDLLELFQGPIPINDRIIIATTNHFDEIKNSLPALFRPGRLTPINFDYMDWASFIELCEYYFKSKPTCEEFNINIPTSQIIEIAKKYKSIKSDIKEFEDEVKYLVDLKTDENMELETKKIESYRESAYLSSIMESSDDNPGSAHSSTPTLNNTYQNNDIKEEYNHVEVKENKNDKSDKSDIKDNIINNDSETEDSEEDADEYDYEKEESDHNISEFEEYNPHIKSIEELYEEKMNPDNFTKIEENDVSIT